MKKKRAVAYCRYSSDNQREESITAQLRAIKKYCLDKNIEIVKVYTDEAFSATSSDRPAFLRMIDESSSEAFDYVVVHKLDRFARDRYDSAIFKRKLKNNGVRVLSVLENLDDSPESIIYESILEGYSEYYSANLGREVTKGLKENAYQAKFNGGNIPFGYDIIDQKYVINEAEAAIVRDVFLMYVSGYSHSRIADSLNERGLRNKKGRKFKPNSFVRMLQNENYIGVYSYKIAGETIKIKDAIPAILTEDEFQAALDAKNNRSFICHKNYYNYLLTGLLFQNGEPLVGSSGKSKTGRIYYYYRLRGSSKYYRADKIEYSIKMLIKDVLFFKANIDHLIDSIYEGVCLYSNGDKIDLVENEIRKTEVKIDNIINAIMEGFKSEKLKNELSVLEEKRANLDLELSKLNINKNVDKNEVKEFIYSYKNKLDDEETLKFLMHQLIDKIEIDSTGALQVELKNLTSSSYKYFVAYHSVFGSNLVLRNDCFEILNAA